MAAARAVEYTDVIAEAAAASGATDQERAGTARRLRGELRRINRRDYFPPPERDTARLAVHNLTASAGNPEPATQVSGRP